MGSVLAVEHGRVSRPCCVPVWQLADSVFGVDTSGSLLTSLFSFWRVALASGSDKLWGCLGTTVL